MNRRTSTFPLSAHADAPADAIEQTTGEPDAGSLIPGHGALGARSGTKRFTAVRSAAHVLFT
jgi:hypothetical protein